MIPTAQARINEQDKEPLKILGLIYWSHAVNQDFHWSDRQIIIRIMLRFQVRS